MPSATTTATTTKDVLTGMYAAEAAYFAAGGPGRASFTTLAPFFADDVVLYQAEGMPYGGIWRGHAGLERFFATMAAVWETFELVEQQFLATGETAVVHTEVRARARATGRELRFPILQTLRVEDGRIAEIRPFYWDTKEIAEACTIAR
ncbi:nuclear transport factor 2 family protein [Nocardia sp. NPDC004654]|uniref:nuclear transport factor 2 family protein n=1 Tax=Nocardia sp. NPDC004654 TaxID=3154776 RepID=UPI0033BC2AEA